MCVGIDSFSDPPEAQGLAHSLEHMLFMGSTEFPDENEVCFAIEYLLLVG
ncbi:putative nardilysin [Rosa chinensis]|uniref:Putative nardilysin n=1 Tax=Rosa chinensis TaxID=74649 RepID=A0A2P6S9A8_ROSCH|nr:putative nardilysin [Rosa chinensis]